MKKLLKLIFIITLASLVGSWLIPAAYGQTNNGSEQTGIQVEAVQEILPVRLLSKPLQRMPLIYIINLFPEYTRCKTDFNITVFSQQPPLAP